MTARADCSSVGRLPNTSRVSRSRHDNRRSISALPAGLTRTVARLNDKGVRLYETMPLPVNAESPGTSAVPGDSTC